MHAGHIAVIILGLVTISGVLLYWWTDREHFPIRSYRDNDRTIPSIAGAVLWIVTGAVLLIWLVLISVMNVETIICEDSATKLDTSSEYSWTAGCFIVIDGDLIPYDLYRLQESL